MALVSVCIANYNGIDLIDDCIASVRAQEGGVPAEILVFDDASTDGSARHIRARHPDVVLIESDANAGFCVANNRMAAVARGKYLLLLNNDATLLPDALSTLQAEAGRLLRPAILSLPQYNATTGELLDIGSLLDPFLNSVPNRDRTRNEVGMVAGACLWIDKALWQALGGFPAWFGSLAEDLYLCCRARLAGHPVRALGVSGYRHRVGYSFSGGKAGNGRLATTFRRRALSERNKTYVMAMTYPAPYLQIVLPLHLILLLTEGVTLSILNGRLKFLKEIYLPVFTGLIIERNNLRAVRANVIKSRCLGGADFFAVFDWVPHKLRMLARYGLPSVR